MKGQIVEVGTSYMEEYNYISEYQQTCFYMRVDTKPIKYGVCINVKDIQKVNEIINSFRKEQKACLEAWRKELLQTKYINRITKDNKEKQEEYINLLMNGGNIIEWIKNNVI